MKEAENLSLLRACLSGDYESTEKALNQGADPNCKLWGTCGTPLHIAVTHGFIEIVKLLVSRGADLNQINILGASALDMAMMHGLDDMTQALLTLSVDLN